MWEFPPLGEFPPMREDRGGLDEKGAELWENHIYWELGIVSP